MSERLAKHSDAIVDEGLESRDGQVSDRDTRGATEKPAASTPDFVWPSSAMPDFVWQSSLRQTFRLLPPPAPTDTMSILLNSDGDTDTEVLHRLPFAAARSGQSGAGAHPDARRLRDPVQVAQTVGLLYLDDHKFRLTELGKATARWLPALTVSNWKVLGRHAAYSLAACQLRNPSRAGQKYPLGNEVFPYAFVWRAMLALDGKISSDELNRALLRVQDLRSLDRAIDTIRRRRQSNGSLEELGDETVTGTAKNDRLIPWISLASFGYLFIQPKDAAHFYRFRPGAAQLLRGPAMQGLRTREFTSVAQYVEHLSDQASLPEDLR